MNDIREAIEQSMADIEDGNTDRPEPALDEIEANDPPEDNTGVEVEEPQEPEGVTVGEQDDQPKEAQENASDETAAESAKAEKAPAGWTPANREHWAGLPDALKTQISKREREVNDVLQKSAGSRKFQEGFNNMTGQYRNVMQSEGINDPLQAVNGLFQTASTLVSGNPQVKAKRIAEMIQHYNIDISALDDILSGQQPQQQQDDPMMKALDARLAPMQQMFDSMQNQQTQVMQSQQASVDTEVASFEQNAEFINDVRNDMADLLDMSAKRGQEMTLQQAYDKAVTLNPEISKVLAQRKQQNDLGIKKTAAVSLNGKLGGNEQDDAGAGSLRDTLDAAWSGEI